MEDITNAVLEELTGSCAECGITSDIIAKPSFACYPESPAHVTYRARLEGTSETDSGSLISLIDDWVSGVAGIIVTGVLMTVDSECSVAISSITERECSSTQPPYTDPTTSSTMTTMDPTTSSNMTTTDSTTNSGTAPSTDTTASTISQSSSDNTAAIIGGVVAVILIISIAITAIVALVMKNRRGVLSIEKADK